METVKYFDNAATTRVKEEVLRAMWPYFMEYYGNASAMYSLGRRNKKAIEESRKNVASIIGAKPNNIIFTSCGSESDNMAIKGFAHANKFKGNHIITSKIEHHAVLESCEQLEKNGFKVTYLNVDKDGIINFEELINSINNETILITIMLANNEIGTIEPIEKVARIAKEKNVVLHTDAVQAVGNIDVDVEKLGVDMLSLSGHKLYGPKGIGALYLRDGIKLEKFLNGGHQEKNMRAGTENVAGIVGLGEACRLAKANLPRHKKHLAMLRNYYFEQLPNNFPHCKVHGPVVNSVNNMNDSHINLSISSDNNSLINNRLPGNANVSFPQVDASTLLIKLDELGICASAGSACNTGITSPSHVLTSIGLDKELAFGALRVTFGEDNTIEDVDYLVESIKSIIEKL